MKKILNFNSQQFTVNVKSLNIQAISFNIYFSDVFDLKKKFKNEKTIFMNVNAAKQ